MIQLNVESIDNSDSFANLFKMAASQLFISDAGTAQLFAEKLGTFLLHVSRSYHKLSCAFSFAGIYQFGI